MTLIKTNLEGKIRNLPHFKSEALLPLFEAVVNSIEAIEERNNLSTGEIEVQVIRESQLILSESDIPAITDFVVIDNGIGFDDANYEAFQTSDTTHKLEKGAKGVGRFLWLKAFNSVDIDSVYAKGQEFKKRKIKFTVSDGIKQEAHLSTIEQQKTAVRLSGFKDEYRKLPTAYKTTEKIAQRILEHCLSYFISEGAPKIVVVDQGDRIVLNDVYSTNIMNNMYQESITIGEKHFSLVHIKLYSTHDKMHNIVLCANRRDVKTINLAKALGTSSQFDDKDRKFTYALYVTSTYLDSSVDNYRLDFEIPSDTTFFSDTGMVSMDQLIEAITNAAKMYLSEYLDKTRKRKEELVGKYVETENPALRAVPYYCPEVFDEIEPNTSDEKMNEVLYRYKGKAEYEIRKRSEELLRTQSATIDEIQESYQKLTSQITDFQKDDLVNYLCNRKRILLLLEKKLELNSDGKYSNEDIIHDIIFPRKTTTDQLAFENHNLWLLGENLTFHAFAASDKPLSQFSSSSSDERPDIIAFAEIDDDKVARAVSIMEFKKPQRTSFDEDPTKQLYRYLREIKNSQKVKLPNGRDLVVSEMTRFYCYAICDISSAIIEFVENGNYAKLKGELGFYTYNRVLNAHTEILAFDKIVNDAKRRHKAFFSILGVD